MFTVKADPKYEILAYNLYRFGFPMMYDGLDTTDLPIEEVITRILKEHPNPRFILGLPVVIYRNKINTSRIYSLAAGANAINEVGWMLEEAYEIYKRCAGTERKDIAKLIRRLEPLKKKEETVIALDSMKRFKCFIPYARERQTPTGQKWGVLSGNTEEGFDYEFKRRCMKSLEKLLTKVLPRI